AFPIEGSGQSQSHLIRYCDVGYAFPVKGSGQRQSCFVGYVGTGSSETGDNAKSILEAINGEVDSEGSADSENGPSFQKHIEEIMMTNINPDPSSLDAGQQIQGNTDTAQVIVDAAAPTEQVQAPQPPPTPQRLGMPPPPAASLGT
ncbi:hypothetical protein JBE27_55860, partial [Streptomyces albiflaviniger]|nr:hypothetical protein [Streptomyces albiflaviniger]